MVSGLGGLNRETSIISAKLSSALQVVMGFKVVGLVKVAVNRYVTAPLSNYMIEYFVSQLSLRTY